MLGGTKTLLAAGAGLGLAQVALAQDLHWSQYIKLTGDADEYGGICTQTTCQAKLCSMYMYDNGGGFYYLDSCDETDALEEAKAEYMAIMEEQASDDIGQLLLQLESVLEARGRSFAADCKNQDFMEAQCVPGGGSEVVAHGCKCSCACDDDSCDYENSSCESTNPSVIELGILRRFKNLKAMVMTMQPVNVTVFGRYCYYGCWCLPNGQHNLAAGYGMPVDPIDEVCKEFALCYKCLEMDFAGECNPEARAYRWGRVRDDDGVTYDLSCKDNHERGPAHRCKRYTCECDRVLAMGLHYTHWYWNESHHARWGGFDREASCATACDNCQPQDDCCGAYGSASTDIADPLTRRPYASTSPNSGCCQDVYYFNINSQECCIDGENVSVEEMGTCSGSVVDPDEVDDFDENFPGYTRK